MANSGQYGSFVPTTNIWDVSQIYSTEGISPELQELLVRMYQNLNQMSLALNTKTSGFYNNDNQQFVNGNVWFPNPANSSQSSPYVNPVMRQEQTQVLNLPQNGSGFALPAGDTITINHQIVCTAQTTFVGLDGMASDTVGFNYYPINYAGSETISAFANGTQVSITNNTAINFTICYVVLRFLQS